MSYNIAIIKCEYSSAHEPWIEACRKNSGISSYTVIDIAKNNWIDEVLAVDYDLFLLRPPGQTDLFKRVFDERIFILSKILNKNIYPNFEEILIYENKKFLRDWLKSRNLPHPNTQVFFYQPEAEAFIQNNFDFPIVAKTNVGASGSGVVFLKTKTDALKYIQLGFSRGVKAKVGPKIFKGSVINKIKKLFSSKQFVVKRFQDYRASAKELQKGYLIFQEFITHSYEWRCVKIGESYFAHKKIAKDNMSSGTLLKGYDPVPLRLLDFIKATCDNNNLSSVSIDIFVKGEDYLINEIQCFFGQSDPYQMLVDGKPGRYVFKNNEWIFEEGMFNTNFSYDLRLEHALKILKGELC